MSDKTSTMLAQYNPQDRNLLQKIMLKHSSTLGRDVEAKRIKLSQISLSMEALIQQVLDDSPKAVCAEKKAESSNTANLLGLLGIVTGLELLVDSVTLRRTVKLKGGGMGSTRLTLGEMIRDLTAGVVNEEDGVANQLEMLTEMVNDIGVKWQAFTDEKTGLSDPHKYLSPEPTQKSEEVLADENEAVSAEESEALNTSVIDQIKKGKK